MCSSLQLTGTIHCAGGVEEKNSTRNQREQVRVLAAFEGPQISGRGTIRDISTSGARIEEIDDRPGIGTPLVVQLFMFPNQHPVTLVANVVRETESGGFAVEFDGLDDRTRSLLHLTLTSHPIAQPWHQNERRVN